MLKIVRLFLVRRSGRRGKSSVATVAVAEDSWLTAGRAVCAGRGRSRR